LDERSSGVSELDLGSPVDLGDWESTAAFQTLLLQLAASFITLPLESVDAAIHDALEKMARFVGADRAYVFAYDFLSGSASNTHEWCAPGITPQIDYLQDIRLEFAPEWVIPHQRGEAVFVPDVAALPASGLTTLLQAQKIKSLVALPLYGKQGCLGCVGFDAVTHARTYAPEESRLLHLFASLLMNVHERKHAEESVCASQALLRTVIDGIPDPIVLKDKNGNFLLGNSSCARLYGTTPEAMIGKHDGDFGVPAEIADGFRKNVLEIMARGVAEVVLEESRDAVTGQIRHYRSFKKPLKDRDGNDQILVIAHDITDIVEAQSLVVESEHRLQEVMQITREGLWDWHIPSGQVAHNPQWYASLQAAPEDTPDTVEEFAALVHPEDRQLVWQRLEAVLTAANDEYHSEHRLVRKDGTVIWVQDRGKVIERDADGKAVRLIGAFSDITYQKEHQRQLEQIAHFDALTGLPNRTLLADRMQQAMAHCNRRGQQLAVAYLDLDGFKVVNDHHGHDMGDHLLRVLADRMRVVLRQGDTLARLGGDEFVAVILDLDDIESCIPMLSRLLAAASEEVIDGDVVLKVSASLGVTFYPQDEGIDADQLLRQADQAMYQAKLAGKNQYHLFDTERDRSLRGHHNSLDRIRQALCRREFVLYYQPKVNMRTGRLVGAEALIRWQHPERGLLPPAAFLPVIEGHAVAVEIGDWVIQSALAQMQAWKHAGLVLPVSVNVGALQLQKLDFIDNLRSMLAAAPDVEANDLELEILETSALQDIAKVSAVMRECSLMGVNFALDDFGTGYSSLTYLKRLPAHLLKIDQSFIRDMLDDPEDLAILQGIIGLAQTFRRSVIAEGVETVAHGELLIAMGCEFAQGYGIARPMPADAIPDWARRWRPPVSWLSGRVRHRDDLPLLFADVETRAWAVEVENYIKGSVGSPPQVHLTGLGHWLEHEGEQRFGKQAMFAELSERYRSLHAHGWTLLELKGKGMHAEATAGLAVLHSLRDHLSEHLKDFAD